jgi:addiction module HigA family antidote
MTLKFKRCCRTFDFFSEIINGRCGLTPETAIRIAIATDTSPESWLNMQTKLDLWNALREKPKNILKKN